MRAGWRAGAEHRCLGDAQAFWRNDYKRLDSWLFVLRCRRGYFSRKSREMIQSWQTGWTVIRGVISALCTRTFGVYAFSAEVKSVACGVQALSMTEKGRLRCRRRSLECAMAGFV